MFSFNSPVVELLKSRVSRPKPFTPDGCHLALVVEGGGMRGVAAGGMVSALEKMGLTHVFDSVHGSSAGAAAAAYFAVERARIGTSLYYEDLNDNRFIDKWRFLLGKPILSSSYLVDDAMVNIKPFDFQKLRSGRIKLNIVTTDIDNATSYTVSEFRDYEHYRSLLKASVTLPIIAGGVQFVDGKRLLDGGLLQQIALKSAEAAGATHIIALLTRGEHELERPQPTAWTRLEAAVMQKVYGGKIAEIYFNRGASINDQVAQIRSGKTHSGTPLSAIGLPVGLDYIHRLTKQADILKKAALAAESYVENGLYSILELP